MDQVVKLCDRELLDANKSGFGTRSEAGIHFAGECRRSFSNLFALFTIFYYMVAGHLY